MAQYIAVDIVMAHTHTTEVLRHVLVACCMSKYRELMLSICWQVATAGSPPFMFHTTLHPRWEESTGVSSPVGSFSSSAILNILLITSGGCLAFKTADVLANVLWRQ